VCRSAGRVDNQHVNAAALGRFAGVVRNGRRIRAHLVFHDLNADPLRPDGQLIDRRGTKSVAGADHHLFFN